MGRTRTRLKVLRVMRDLTQHQVAQQARMNQTRYWQIENGAGLEPTPDERDAVAAALDAKVAEIDWPEVGVRAS